ncbi:unnamed protein product [Acanthosepion pharaonis]|uniref:Helitron helicase-like domain-containing protein n=1 Tax=Acanthosepion pharaonis TaxID=158019 RepID=A0A812ECT7_ACAPH|nr:unnamed protein product [Sepia pharaonis]
MNTRATAASRVSEQPQETAHRRFRNALSTASARALESSAQTTVSRVRNGRSTASARVIESPAQTTVRRAGKALSTASARALESSAQTTVRRPPRDLLLGATSESRHFLEAIRKYNCCFQMTSFGAKAISEWGWMPPFKVQGQVYHLMGSLFVDQGEPPQFLQIYYLADYNEQVDARLGILPSDISVGPRRDILFRLQDMLHETNSYTRSLKFALQNNSSPSFSVGIVADRRPHGEHERRFNAPACNEVTAVIHGEEHNSRDIVIRFRGGGLRRISEIYRSYDCLQYPLLFPYGSDGYNFKIPIYQASSDSMSTSKMVSYAYMFFG